MSENKLKISNIERCFTECVTKKKWIKDIAGRYNCYSIDVTKIFCRFSRKISVRRCFLLVPYQDDEVVQQYSTLFLSIFSVDRPFRWKNYSKEATERRQTATNLEDRWRISRAILIDLYFG